MELPLETVALFALKLAYETEGESSILRDDPIMNDYERELHRLPADFGAAVTTEQINAPLISLKNHLKDIQ